MQVSNPRRPPPWKKMSWWHALQISPLEIRP
jgi:hypothetical protein